jgi:hypothetical protein
LTDVGIIVAARTDTSSRERVVFRRGDSFIPPTFTGGQQGVAIEN